MNIIDNTYIFGYILDYLRTAKCKIILVINHNSLLSELYKPFIKLIYNKTYSFSHTSLDNKKKKTKHMIVTNIDVMTTIQINEKGKVRVLYNKDDMIVPNEIKVIYTNNELII